MHIVIISHAQDLVHVHDAVVLRSAFLGVQIDFTENVFIVNPILALGDDQLVDLLACPLLQFLPIP